MLDQRSQSLRLLGEHRLERGLLLSGEAVFAGLERESAAEDGRGRSSELVRGNCDEPITDMVELHQPVVQLCTLDPERCAFRSRLEELRLVSSEVTRR